jgi:hypothetical protein
MLSLDRGALTTPREAHALFIENAFESVRVYGIVVGEFSSESIPSYSDPLSAPPLTKANPFHALADYSAHTTAKQKIVSKRLKRLASARGCLFNADHARPP